MVDKYRILWNISARRYEIEHCNIERTNVSEILEGTFFVFGRDTWRQVQAKLGEWAYLSEDLQQKVTHILLWEGKGYSKVRSLERFFKASAPEGPAKSFIE